MIYNQSLFKWKQNSPNENDYLNFEYIGNAFLSFELSEDNTFLKYQLKKSVMNEVLSANMKFYFVFEEPNRSFASIVPNSGINISVSPIEVTSFIDYWQKSFNLYSPHGYYLSEIVKYPSNSTGLSILYSAYVSDNTQVKLYTRIKKDGEPFDDFELANRYFYHKEGKIENFQYAICLDTQNGKQTPKISNIRMFTDKQIQPKSNNGVEQKINIATVLTEKIEYFH